MKVPAGTILPFASWIAPKAAIRGVPEVTLSESALSVIKAAGPSASCEWFTQPVDHNNAELGTWEQLYCVNPAQWQGPGSPVVIMTPGESGIYPSISANRGYTFLDNTTMPGLYAQAIGAATVVIEHRYFGGSSPYDGFDSETLQFLTMEQAASDIVNFAKNVVFPFETNKTSVASAAPWIYFGTSYSATLGSWIERFYPGVFHAFHLSSASVEVNTNNWYYYDTIRKGIDAYRKDTSCSLALNEVSEFVDRYLLAKSRNETEVNALKLLFGSSADFPIEDDDFAYAIATPFRYWQETNGYLDVLEMCDAVVGSQETEDNAILGTIPATVANFAAYFRMNFRDSTCTYLDTWGQQDPLWCLNTHDHLNPYVEARTLGNPWRTWYWFLCNEPLASWAIGAPKESLSIVSRKIDSQYWQRQCELHFPPENGQKYGSSNGKTPETLNKETGGWTRNSTRVIWTSGEFDPWRATGMSSEVRPGGPLASSDKVAVFLMKNAVHGDDAFSTRALANLKIKPNPEVVKTQEQAVALVKKWVAQYYVERTT